MCGIAGIWGKGDIRRMTEPLQNRGPDSEGYFENEFVRLGIRRLAVLDLEHGDQPMTSEKKTHVIVHNGEVYNYEDIRDDLIRKGYRFKTRTDTEVILYSYVEWGEECVHRFNGMFAFAIWDETKKRLFIARDRVGVKPLFWAHVQGRFLFASEIKAILKEYSSAPDLHSSFFSFECPVHDRTLFENIHSLLPGHYLVYNGKDVELRQYWKIGDEQSTKEWNREEAIEELRWLAQDAIRLRMKSDVPVGLFASGGIDSSIIACVSGVEFLYCCRYPYGSVYDEYHYARLLGKHLEKPVICITPQPEDLQENLQGIIYSLDYPIATASSISEFLLARRAAADVKVVLGGQGADEIFGGYVRYLVMLAGNQTNTNHSFRGYEDLLKHFNNRQINLSFGESYLHLSNRGSSVEDRREFVGFFSSSRSRTDQMGLCDMVYVLPSLLTMNDRAGAHVGLENRTPFLDYRIVEFAFRLPEELKIEQHRTKVILREAFKGIIPEPIRVRTDKKGLVTPVQLWLNGPLKAWAMDLSQKLNQRGIQWPVSASRGEFDRNLYSRICLELWFQTFFPDFTC